LDAGNLGGNNGDWKGLKHVKAVKKSNKTKNQTALIIFAPSNSNLRGNRNSSYLVYLSESTW